MSEVDAAFRDDSSNSSGKSGTLLTTDGDTHVAVVDGPAEGNRAATDTPDDAETADPDATGIAGIDVGITPRDAARAAKEKREEGITPCNRGITLMSIPTMLLALPLRL